MASTPRVPLLQLFQHLLVTAQHFRHGFFLDCYSPKPDARLWHAIHRVTGRTVCAPGVRMIGNLVNARPDALHAGMAVEAVFTPSEDGSVQLICWQPASRPN